MLLYILLSILIFSFSSELKSKLSSLLSNTLCTTATSVDLSSLTHTSGTDYIFSDNPSSHVSYSMNVCADTLVSCLDSATSPMIYYADASTCYQLGHLDTAIWNGNTVTYTNGDPCNEDGPISKWSGSIQFVCGKQLAEITMIELNGCQFQYTLSTNLVCGHDPTSNGSGGSAVNMGLVAFLCVFFGGFFIYFAIGMGYNYYYRSQGSEVTCYGLLPDKDFWLYVYYLCKLPFSWCALIDKPVYEKSSPSDDITSNSSSKYGTI